MSMRSRQDPVGEEFEATEEFESPGSPGAAETWQDETEEMEIAAELLGITNELELEQFIGSLLQKAARTAGSVLASPVLQPLARTLTTALKRTLPILGASSGATLASGVGSDVARNLAAARSFGLELEGLSPEDQEFELARRFVRLARSAGRRAPRFARRFPPRVAVRRTLVAAARRHAPGLLRRRRRRIRRGARILVPTRIVYAEPPPEPVIEPEPPAAAEPADADQSPPPDEDPDASAGADQSGTPDTAEEPATERGAARSACTCGGTCAHRRSAAGGRWVRQGANIILQDV